MCPLISRIYGASKQAAGVGGPKMSLKVGKIYMNQIIISFCVKYKQILIGPKYFKFQIQNMDCFKKLW